MKNNTMKEISAKLAESRSVFLFPHVHMDGDALGSASALCGALRKLGKTAWILIEDEIADNLQFLERGYCVDVNCFNGTVQNGDAEKLTEQTAGRTLKDVTGTERADICLCIDCGDTGRFEKRRNIFTDGVFRICLDHHATSKPFAEMNYIDPKAAATGEIVYDLLRELETVYSADLIDEKIGEAIFSAIMTDTGNFQYSNTTSKSHKVAAELIELGVDFHAAAVKLYQNINVSRVRLNAKAIERMKIFAGGRAAMTSVTQMLMQSVGAAMNEAEGIAETMRNLRGVEIAVLLKENDDGWIRASLRAKTKADVARIASRFGGGGHVKAAGCTLKMTMQEAEEQMTAAVEEALQEKEMDGTQNS